LISFFFLYIQQKEKNFSFLITTLLIITTSYFVEVLGVKTGIIFGTYVYGDNLGPKILDTPPIIGLNWFILLVGAASFFHNSKWHFLIKAAVAATLMVSLDILIERVAPFLGYWTWENDIVPFKNYLAWWMTGFALQIVYWRSPFPKQNPLARYLFMIIMTFFFLLNFLV
jgi:putative membrane protein